VTDSTDPPPPPRGPYRSHPSVDMLENGEDVSHWSDRDLILRMVNTGMRTHHTMGALDKRVSTIEQRLSTDYQDTKTLELNNLRSRQKWLTTLLTALITAVSIAEVLSWLGLKK
jgi:hypothetical protein